MMIKRRRSRPKCRVNIETPLASTLEPKMVNQKEENKMLAMNKPQARGLAVSAPCRKVLMKHGGTSA